MTDCATKLAEAKDALHKLQLGAAVVRVTVDGQTVEKKPADIGALRVYVAELEAECGGSTIIRRAPGRVVY